MKAQCRLLYLTAPYAAVHSVRLKSTEARQTDRQTNRQKDRQTEAES